MTVLLLLWVVIASMIAVYCHAELLNEREASLLSFGLSKAEKDDLRRQRDVLFKMICDVYEENCWLSDLANEQQMSIFDGVRDELDGCC